MRKGVEYQKAIEMRRKGRTYNEILEVIPVAKSTLSLWLRSIGLAKPQQQRISNRRTAAQRKGALARHAARVEEIEKFIHKGIDEVGGISRRELWLIGVALYWAEGSKQNIASISAGIQFANSDARMLRLFLTWLEAMHIPTNDIGFDLYVHDNRKSEIESFRSWWSDQLGVSRDRLDKVYFKRDKPKTNRTNVGDLYHGLLRIRVRSSTALNRQVNGWIAGIAESCRFV